MGVRLLLFWCIAAAIACSSAAAAAGSSRTPQSSQATISCYSCIYYANIRVSISNEACISGKSIDTVNCYPGAACKVTFLQDSRSSIVHASRSCQQPGTFRSDNGENVSVILTARSTMYCRQFGCNNNWMGAPSLDRQRWRRQSSGGSNASSPRDQLHCWVGYGRHIDQFKLRPCNQKILRLALNGNGTGTGQSPVCLLAQLTRQIEYNGRVYESVAYMADCVPHASSVYGQYYPMFEYERVCRSPKCNSGVAAEKIGIGLMMAAATGVPQAAVSIFVMVASATAVATLLHVRSFTQALYL